jgi:hypothetical protein
MTEGAHELAHRSEPELLAQPGPGPEIFARRQGGGILAARPRVWKSGWICGKLGNYVCREF